MYVIRTLLKVKVGSLCVFFETHLDYFCSYFNRVSFDGCCSQGIWVQVTGAFGTIILLESGRFARVSAEL